MRALNFFISIVVIAILTSCTCATRHRYSTGISSDTTVNSLPVNYMKTVENMPSSNKLEIRSYQDILNLFEKLHYMPETWQAGIREVPRVYLTIIGERWGSTTSKEISVDLKKRIFFRTIAPMILHANELIMMDRNRLEQIRSSFKRNNSLTEKDHIWIRKLSQLYKVKILNNKVTEPMLEELWEKVDIVPPSLALAQGAEESGWGTSRFAGIGNSIYGQWSWGKNAITPENQRKSLGNYGIAAFGSLQESVCAYMLNLNTHNAYSALRARRANLRKNGNKITGIVLAKELTRYSERGEEYVNGLKSLMEVNRLEPADDAYLSDGAPVYLIPVADDKISE